MGKYIAITIATILATVVTYLGNRYWTFRHRQSQGAPPRQRPMFFLLHAVVLLIYYACIRPEPGPWRASATASSGTTRPWSSAPFLGTLFRFLVVSQVGRMI